jgi:hypothetical protein
MQKSNAMYVTLVLLLALFASGQTTPAAQGTKFRITGTLVNSITGEPIANAQVTVSPVTARDQITTFITGADGHFSFSGLVSGKYSLMARRRGYITRAFDQHEQYSSAIAVGPGLSSENLRFRLLPDCEIGGTVTDEAGEAVRDATITLYRNGVFGGLGRSVQVTTAQTNDLGAFRFSHLATGDYMLAVVARVWYAQRSQPRPTTLKSIAVLRPSLGAEVAPSSTFGDSSTSAGGIVSGVVPTPITGPVNQTNETEEEVSSPLDVVYPVTFYPGVTESSSATPIHVNPGEKFIADLSLQPVPALRFEVSGPYPHDSGISVDLQQPLAFGGSVRMDVEQHISPSGKMEIVGLAPGRYQMRITDYSDKGSSSGFQEKDITIGSTGSVDESSDKPGVHVTAAFTREPGTGVPSRSYLQLFNPKTRAYFSERVPEKGELEFKRPIPAGTYLIALTPNDGAFIKSIAATGAKVANGLVTFGDQPGARLALGVGRGYGQITGVAMRAGKPFAGAMIVLVPADAPENTALIRRDQSDTDGTFTLGYVVPGKYRVFAIANGWELEWMNPVVRKRYEPGALSAEVGSSEKKSVKMNVQ